MDENDTYSFFGSVSLFETNEDSFLSLDALEAQADDDSLDLFLTTSDEQEATKPDNDDSFIQDEQNSNESENTTCQKPLVFHRSSAKYLTSIVDKKKSKQNSKKKTTTAKSREQTHLKVCAIADFDYMSNQSLFSVWNEKTPFQPPLYRPCSSSDLQKYKLMFRYKRSKEFYQFDQHDKHHFYSRSYRYIFRLVCVDTQIESVTRLQYVVPYLYKEVDTHTFKSMSVNNYDVCIWTGKTKTPDYHEWNICFYTNSFKYKSQSLSPYIFKLCFVDTSTKTIVYETSLFAIYARKNKT